MEKTITFNIPEGYVIDKENSTSDNIVLKRIESTRLKTWEEYCDKMKGKNSYFMTCGYIHPAHFLAEPVLSEFTTKEDVEIFAAYSKLLKLRKYWVGDWEPDWTDMGQLKFTIINQRNKVLDCVNDRTSHSMSFPTKEMRDEFLVCFKDLLEKAKTLI